MILFEYPFNERIRTYLRLEYLFDRLSFFAHEQDLRHHQIAMTTLFDILEATERTEIKTAVLQDLERQRGQLAPLRGHPGVAQPALESFLGQFEESISALTATGRTGQSLRQNDWLVSLRGRLAVPGGATQVDMPSYHAWQHRPVDVRMQDLQNWMAPLMPLCHGVAIALQMLRGAGESQQMLAEEGAYQQMLAGKTYQLLRVWVAPDGGIFPEISANKYMVWIRFSAQVDDLKPQPTTESVPFSLALCNV